MLMVLFILKTQEQDGYKGADLSPAAAFAVNLQFGALDEPLDVSGQSFALQVHTQRLPGEDRIQVRRDLQQTQDLFRCYT